MKILDKYLLKLFITTFLTVFVILFFIFILQTVWLFISELAGKDLDFVSVIKFLLFATPRVVPLVLPLSVLLASIMTFGSLSENYEFAAMKSSGISLKRAMNSLIVFIGVLSLIAFIFANNVIPYAEFKFINFRRNIAQVKPAMAIAEGQFSVVGNYTIKVEKKSGDEGRFLENVTIHKNGNLGAGNSSVIKAKTGEIVSNKNSNILKLVLKDGNYYEDILPKKYEERNKVPFAKSDFNKYVINIDLSKFNSANLDEAEITNTNTMLTISELKYTLDSLSKNYTKELNSFIDNTNDRTFNTNMNYSGNQKTLNTDSIKTPNLDITTSLISSFKEENKPQIYNVAKANIDGINFYLESSTYEFENKIKNINGHWIALFDKFVIGFSCILMFFIGAPLGAIIRKGGLGLPIVFAVLIFIIYHFINTFGKKLAQENGISPFLGSWMATLILLPFAIFLTKRATDDKGVMSINLFPFIEWFEKLLPKKAIPVTINSNIADSETFPLQESSDDFIEITTTKMEKSALITAASSASSADLEKKYTLYSTAGLLCNLALLATVFLQLTNPVVFVVLGILLIAAVIKAELIYKTILKEAKSTYSISLAIIVLTAIPFYFIFYLHNKIALRGLQKQQNQVTK